MTAERGTVPKDSTTVKCRADRLHFAIDSALVPPSTVQRIATLTELICLSGAEVAVWSWARRCQLGIALPLHGSISSRNSSLVWQWRWQHLLCIEGHSYRLIGRVRRWLVPAEDLVLQARDRLAKWLGDDPTGQANCPAKFRCSSGKSTSPVKRHPCSSPRISRRHSIVSMDESRGAPS